MEIGELPRELQDLVQGEVRNDEKWIWAEQPDPNRMMLSGMPSLLIGIPMMAFSLHFFQRAFPMVTCAFGLGECTTNAGIFLFFGVLVILCGLAFALVSLAMLAVPFLKKSYALKSVYVLTDKRAICFNKMGVYPFNKGLKGYEILSYLPEKLINMRKVVRGNGTGDLIFPEIPIRSPGPDILLSLRKVGFLAIKNVNDVEDLIRKTLSVK